MKVYTRAGDKGTTSLGHGAKVSKDNQRVHVLGEVDELVAQLGLLVAHSVRHKPLLSRVQDDLYMLMAHVANTKMDHRFTKEKVKSLENYIDAADEKLPPLRNFVIPGANVPSAQAHVCRVVCRRTERCLVSLGSDDVTLCYINRLSDVLFVVARELTTEEEVFRKS